MKGSTAWTRSPARTSTIRNTPWVLGCWGPMLSDISTVSRLCSSTTGGVTGAKASICRSPRSVAMVVSFSSSSGGHFLGEAVHPGRLLGAQLESLEEDRAGDDAPLFVLLQQDGLRVGVAGEDDVEHLGRLPLVPVGPGPDPGDRGEALTLARD